MKSSQQQSLYYRLGGEPVLREFVDHLYDFMDSLPEVKTIRAMHAEDLSHTREAVFMFLSGMLGGPPLYVQQYGPPRLRRQHLRFPIGDSERDQWLLCAQKSVDRLVDSGKLSQENADALMDELSAMASHLRNQGDAAAGGCGHGAVRHCHGATG